MNSFFYGLGLIAILVIIHWYVANDGMSQNDGSVGFLAMKPVKPRDIPTGSSSAKKSFRRKQ